MPSEEYPPSSDDESDYRGLSTSGGNHNVHLLPPRCDDILEINIESLLGTTFELRLSSTTTIGRIKSRLQVTTINCFGLKILEIISFTNQVAISTCLINLT
jgi:hypothetical protein